MTSGASGGEEAATDCRPFIRRATPILAKITTDEPSFYGPETPLPAEESTPANPCSLYALTKFHGEQWGRIRDQGSRIEDRGSWIEDRGSWMKERALHLQSTIRYPLSP